MSSHNNNKHLGPIYTSQCAAYCTKYNKECDVLFLWNNHVNDPHDSLSSNLVLTKHNDQITVPKLVARHYSLAEVAIDGKGA